MRTTTFPNETTKQVRSQQHKNDFLQNNKDKDKQGQQQKKQKKKSVRISLKPQHFQTGKGLKKLYQLTNQIKWQDAMTIQSAMNLVVLTLKSWQYELMPKYYHQLFFQRCQVLGAHKLVTAFMSKVRKIHKGEAQWDDTGDQNKTDNTANKNRESSNNVDNDDGLNLQNHNTQQLDQNYDAIQANMSQLQKFRQRAQLAKKLGNVTVTNNTTATNQKTNQEQVDEMMDQDLRLFQEMRKRMSNINNGNKSKNQVEDDYEDEGMELGGDSDAQFDYD